MPVFSVLPMRANARYGKDLCHCPDMPYPTAGWYRVTGIPTAIDTRV